MRSQNLVMDDETGHGVLEHQEERKKQHVERSQQVPSAQFRSEDDAAVAQRAKEDPQQQIESPGTPSPGTPVEIGAQGTMSGDDELFDATCATPTQPNHGEPTSPP